MSTSDRTPHAEPNEGAQPSKSEPAAPASDDTLLNIVGKLQVLYDSATKVVSAVFVAAILVWIGFIIRDQTNSLLWVAAYGVLVVLGAISAAGMAAAEMRRNQLTAERRRRSSESVKSAEDKLVSNISGEDPYSSSDLAFNQLLVANQRRIDLYHDIATDQSRRSFRNAQFAAYAGFTVIIVVACVAAFTSSSTGAIAASVIGVAGAGLSAYIGATFMRAQSEASSQLREYFLQPVEFSRTLGAERLVRTIEDAGEQGKAVQEIIKAMMPQHKSPKSS